MMIAQELARIRSLWDVLAAGAGADLYAVLAQQAPRDAKIPQSLALFLMFKGDFDGAIAAIDAAIAIRKDALSFFIKGRAFDEMLDFTRSIDCYQKCLNRDKANPKVRFYLALAYLSLGDFANGTRLYPYRLSPELRARVAGIKRWSPGERPGRVLVWAEQGIGDEIMFLQLLHAAASLDFAFTVECDSRLLTLFHANFPDIRFVARGTPIDAGAYDYQIAFGDLLAPFHAALIDDRIKRPAFVPVPRADVTARVADVAQGRALVGLSWRSGNAEYGLRRSVALETLCRGLDPARDAIAILQYCATEGEIAMLRARGFHCIADFDAYQDIEATLALTAACDSIISIDNSAAHFAGAIGADAHVLLPQLPNWRWGVTGDSSYWYPSLTLHRQKPGMTWDDVIATIGPCDG